ncbi:hypothetical protein COOONC_18201 [Cooperia oncophora]
MFKTYIVPMEVADVIVGEFGVTDAALNDPNVCETALIDLGYADTPCQAVTFVSLIHKLSLLLFYFVFTIFSDQRVSGKACNFFGALSYLAVAMVTSIAYSIFTTVHQRRYSQVTN